MKPFDGCKVKKVEFSTVKHLHRFFNDKGVGYTKGSPSSCYDDHGFEPIHMKPDAIVWIKEQNENRI